MKYKLKKCEQVCHQLDNNDSWGYSLVISIENQWLI